MHDVQASVTKSSKPENENGLADLESLGELQNQPHDQLLDLQANLNICSRSGLEGTHDWVDLFPSICIYKQSEASSPNSKYRTGIVQKENNIRLTPPSTSRTRATVRPGFFKEICLA